MFSPNGIISSHALIVEIHDEQGKAIFEEKNLPPRPTFIVYNVSIALNFCACRCLFTSFRFNPCLFTPSLSMRTLPSSMRPQLLEDRVGLSLGWDLQLTSISHDVAKGMAYLHEHQVPPQLASLGTLR